MLGRKTLFLFVGALAFLCACTDIHKNDQFCKDGGIRGIPGCGINERGYQPERCVDGLWVNDGDCVDPDLCKDGDSRSSVVPCGYNGNGEQPQRCMEGQWMDDGNCIDLDECRNGGWMTGTGDILECVTGRWILRRTTKQWGTATYDGGSGVAIDGAGNIFVTGSTDQALDGNASSGNRDVFLTKWNTDGTKAWTRQWGSGSGDQGNAVAVDNEDNILVTGSTYGSLDGDTRASSGCGGPAIFCTTDIFLTKLTSDGTKVWTKQWGTPGMDEAYALTINAVDDIFVTGKMTGMIDGNTNDGVDCDPDIEAIQSCAPIFLTKWNADGDTYAWTRQWGADARDRGKGIAVDDRGAVFVTGSTNGDLKGNDCLTDPRGICSGDIFLTKWNADGTTEGANSWTHLWGTVQPDHGTALVVDDEGNVFVTGYTREALDENTFYGRADIFLTKFDSEGRKLWTRQWGSSQEDIADSIAIDTDGNILVAGSTLGSFAGFVNAGGSDIFLTKWHPDGTKAWTRQWGTTADDNGRSVAVDKAGRIFVAGFTEGPMDGNTLLGATDIFLTIFPTEKIESAGR